MDKFLKEHQFKVAAFIVLAFFVFIYTSNNSQETSTELQYFSLPVSTNSDITCTYPQVLQAYYVDNKVTHELPKPETNPLIFTFSNVDSDVSTLKYIDATRTISEVPIIKIAEDSEKIIFIDGTGDPYITTHVIYKDMGIATYAKNISLLGTPSGTLSMGTCI